MPSSLHTICWTSMIAMSAATAMISCGKKVSGPGAHSRTTVSESPSIAGSINPMSAARELTNQLPSSFPTATPSTSASIAPPPVVAQVAPIVIVSPTASECSGATYTGSNSANSGVPRASGAIKIDFEKVDEARIQYFSFFGFRTAMGVGVGGASNDNAALSLTFRNLDDQNLFECFLSANPVFFAHQAEGWIYSLRSGSTLDSGQSGEAVRVIFRSATR